MFDIKEHLKTLPASPGVYIMKDAYDNVIYVGKAVVLKNRVRQYFQSYRNHSDKVRSMVKNIKSFEYIMTDSEAEALILECNLIKKYKPKYNVLLRDDKTYPYIKITTNEKFPRVMKVRRISKDSAKYFGPYTNIAAVNETLDTIRSIYPIRTCSMDIEKGIRNKVRPCLNFHINRCIGPCTGMVDEKEYSNIIEEVVMFFSGKEDGLLKTLEEKMYECSSKMMFEEAAKYRDRIESIKELTQRQKITNANSQIDQDVIAMSTLDNHACVQIFFVRNGKVSGRENFMLDGVEKSERYEILGSFIKQFYMNQEFIPKELIVEEDFLDREIMEEILSSKKGSSVSIRIPQKGEKKAMVLMVRKNADEYLIKFDDIKKKKYQKSIGALEELRELLGIEGRLERIESFDISNLQGVDNIGSMVVYTNGVKSPKEYRRFKIKTVVGQDDYASMAEVIDRRIRHGNLPDLILLDGGKGQVSAVKSILDLHDIDIPVWGMFKNDRHRTKGLVNENREIVLDTTSQLFRFIYSIQEEVHRFAISYHRSLRDKRLTKSILDDIKGVGPKKKMALIKAFGDIENMKKATLEEISKFEGINESLAKKIIEVLSGDYKD